MKCLCSHHKTSGAGLFIILYYLVAAVVVLLLTREIPSVAATATATHDDGRSFRIPGAAAAVQRSWSDIKSNMKNKEKDQLSVRAATQVLREYLKRTDPISDFYVQGWRWHTMSLIYESHRLSRACRRDAAAAAADLQRAAEYVIRFNMKGLHQTETQVFMPWIRKRMAKMDSKDETVRRALWTILADLDRQRTRVQQLGIDLMQALEESPGQCVSDTAAAIASQCSAMLRTADDVLVPWVQRQFPKGQQERFNNQVIVSMGLLDSRLHLIGMHQAVVASPRERFKFRQTIPKVTQRMIPRWKRLLYDPKVKALEPY